ncbi:hypothetical protein BMT55_16170 [Listeria newyorkensis]|uniref:Phage tail tape measure protein domain-containing protein n=1 Tax=Listeria newyorkensis TaxID=1497681 RepID=A0ABX4XJC4_9LIST|nr:phage tail tape measure protein [Listeria newyorkensis]PNP87459.1 hypothetical protein BMT55_16170 [Listeria newyorkensis]
MMGNGKIGDLVATAGLDIDPFQQSARVLKTQVRSLGQQMKSAEAAFKGQGNTINGLKNKYQILGQQMKTSEALAQKTRAEYEKQRKAVGDLSTATDKEKQSLLKAEAAMHQAETGVEQLRLKHKALEKDILLASNTFVQHGKKAQEFGTKMQGVGKNISNVGMGITTKFSAPIGVGIGLAVKAASDFESAFTGVKKTVDEVVGKNGQVTYSYQMLEDGIRNMAKQLPASATEISAVAEAAGQLGIQTPNVLSFSRTMIDMGESTNMSSETAATSLARFANITKMRQTDFDKLGSSIVDLGNNFATTESDITEMALRLGGAGSQIGLSQADIVGLSAALSSVGIEAEMGGSAFSKVMVNMKVATETGLDKVKALEKATGMTRRELELLANHDSDSFKAIAIDMGLTTTELNKMLNAGKNLEGFSKVAGMTGEEFKQAFEKDAVGAIGAFVNGLGNAEKHGTSAIELLDEMGFSEVRLRDSLLRAGNASELFGNAVQTSNKAWKENSALTNEATKRYKTFDSQLKIFKNKITDIAIDIGGPFMKAMNSALKAAEPFLDNVKETAKAFSEASPATQKFIVNLGLAAVALGPLTLGMGKLIGAGGTIFSTVGKVSQGIGRLSVQMRLGKTSADLLTAGAKNTGTGLAVATRGASLFGLALNPLGITIGAVTVALVGGYAAWKIWGEKAYDSAQRTKKWGTDVGVSADEALTKVSRFSDDGRVAIATFDQDSKKNAESIKIAYQGIAKVINSSIDDSIKALKKSYEGLDPEMKAFWEKSVKEAEKGAEEQKKVVKEQADAAYNIAKNVSENNRKMTKTEQTMLGNINSALLDEHIKALKLSASQEKNIKAALYSDISQMTKDQSGENASRVSIAAKKEVEIFKQKTKDIERLYEETGNYEAYQASLKSLDSKHNTTLSAMMTRWVELARASGTSENMIEGYLESMGLSLSKLDKASKDAANGTEANLGILSSAAGKADLAWNQMILDPKTGEVRTNALPEIAKAMKSKAGWDNLKFIMKEAKLNSNAKLIIAEAAISSGKWNEMTWTEKKALIENNSAAAVVQALEDNKKWNTLTFEQKSAILKSNSPETLNDVMIQFDLWKNVPWDANKKKAVLETNAPETLKTSLEVNNRWTQLPWMKKNMLTGTNAKETFDSVTRTQKYFNNSWWTTKAANVNTNADYTSSILSRLLSDWGRIPNRDQKILEIAYRTSGKAPSGPQGFATGTPFHPGGLAMVNDAKGRHYRELITTPSGSSYVPEGRNVILNLERGTQILRGDKTSKLLRGIPRYAKGTKKANAYSTKVTNMIADAGVDYRTASISAKAYIERLKQINQQYKLNATQSRKIQTNIASTNKAMVQANKNAVKANEATKKKIQANYTKNVNTKIADLGADYKTGTISAQTYITKLKQINKQYRLNSDQARKIKLNISAATKQIAAQNTKLNKSIQTSTDKYFKQVDAINKKTRDSITEASNNYKEALKSNQEAAYKQSGLFDRVSKTSYDGTGLLFNLKTQTEQQKEFMASINKLKSRKADKKLIEELLQEGLGATGEITAIANLSNADLKAYQAEWTKKHNNANKIGLELSAGEKSAMDKAINDAKKKASTDLASARNSWLKELDKAKQFKNAGSILGKQTVSGIISGFKAMNGPLKKESDYIAKTIENTIKSRLKIHSPSRLMDEEVGRQVPAGIGVGMIRNVGAIIKPVDQVKNLLTKSFDGMAYSVSPKIDLLNSKGMQLLSNLDIADPVAVSKTSNSKNVIDLDELIKSIEQGNAQQNALLAGVIQAISKLVMDKDSMLKYTNDKQGADTNMSIFELGGL